MFRAVHIIKRSHDAPPYVAPPDPPGPDTVKVAPIYNAMQVIVWLCMRVPQLQEGSSVWAWSITPTDTVNPGQGTGPGPGSGSGWHSYLCGGAYHCHCNKWRVCLVHTHTGTYTRTAASYSTHVGLSVSVSISVSISTCLRFIHACLTGPVATGCVHLTSLLPLVAL